MLAGSRGNSSRYLPPDILPCSGGGGLSPAGPPSGVGSGGIKPAASPCTAAQHAS